MIQSPFSAAASTPSAMTGLTMPPRRVATADTSASSTGGATSPTGAVLPASAATMVNPSGGRPEDYQAPMSYPGPTYNPATLASTATAAAVPSYTVPATPAPTALTSTTPAPATASAAKAGDPPGTQTYEIPIGPNGNPNPFLSPDLSPMMKRFLLRHMIRQTMDSPVGPGGMIRRGPGRGTIFGGGPGPGGGIAEPGGIWNPRGPGGIAEPGGIWNSNPNIGYPIPPSASAMEHPTTDLSRNANIGVNQRPGSQAPEGSMPRDPGIVPSTRPRFPGTAGGPIGGGVPQPPPGVIPGSQEWIDWMKEVSGGKNGQFSPYAYLIWQTAMANALGGLWNPWRSLIGLGRTPMQISNHLTGNLYDTLSQWGLGPGQAPQLHTPEYPMPLVNEIAGMGDSYGKTAAGYIHVPDARSITDISNELRAITPASQSLLGMAAPEIARLTADAEAGKGYMGIPESEVKQMQAAGLTQAELAADQATTSINEAASANGQYGQGANATNLNDYYANTYAPARINAVVSPQEKAYEMGLQEVSTLGNLVTSVDQPIMQLSTEANKADLDRVLQAETSQADVYSRLANTGLASGVSAGNTMAGLDLEAQRGNQNAFLQQQQLFSPFIYNSPLKGFDMISQTGGSYNDLLMHMIDTALNQHAQADQRKDNRDAQKNQTWSQGLGGLGSLAGAAIGTLFAPGVGTAIGAGLGGAVGGGFGNIPTTSTPSPGLGVDYGPLTGAKLTVPDTSSLKLDTAPTYTAPPMATSLSSPFLNPNMLNLPSYMDPANAYGTSGYNSFMG